MKIGFFDSGLGGLTILRAVAKRIPQYDYIYYGDTVNLPYGDKSEEEIYKFTQTGVTELFKRDCGLVIIACNTASAKTLRRLQDTFLFNNYPERRVLGVIIPTVEALLDSSTKNALLLTTKLTIESGKYDTELNKQTIRHRNLISVPMSKLVPLIEAGKTEEALLHAIETIDNSLQRAGEVDTVVLGCTHYTLLTEGLRKHYLNRLKVISQDEIIPEKLATYLANHPEITKDLSHEGSREIVLTEHKPEYDTLVQELLQGTFIE